MKKFIPLLLLLIGIFVFVAIFFVMKGKDTTEDEEEVVPEIALEMRPIASLTPSDDGHWLNLNIEKLVIDAESLDYELLYQLPDGRTQGVPGTVQLEGQETIDRDLLLGSESSGKFRYDEGVNQGTLTLRFRNNKGKLVAKFSTDFHLQANSDELTSVDEKFTYMLDEISEEYFVVMETFGIPESVEGSLESGPYGVFSSSGTKLSGTVSFDKNVGYFRYVDGGWVDVGNEKSSDVGIFVALGE